MWGHDFTEVGQQAAIGKEFGDDVDGSLFGADAIQLHEVGMLEFPGKGKPNERGKPSASWEIMLLHPVRFIVKADSVADNSKNPHPDLTG